MVDLSETDLRMSKYYLDNKLFCIIYIYCCFLMFLCCYLPIKTCFFRNPWNTSKTTPVFLLHKSLPFPTTHWSDFCYPGDQHAASTSMSLGVNVVLVSISCKCIPVVILESFLYFGEPKGISDFSAMRKWECGT